MGGGVGGMALKYVATAERRSCTVEDVGVKLPALATIQNQSPVHTTGTFFHIDVRWVAVRDALVRKVGRPVVGLLPFVAAVLAEWGGQSAAVPVRAVPNQVKRCPPVNSC